MKKLIYSGVVAAAILQPAVLGAQQPRSLAEDAAAFGARPAAASVRLSPDGDNLLYLTPGPQSQTVALMSNVTSGKSSIVVRSDGQPESLRWCEYSATDRVVCSIYAIVDTVGHLLPMTREVSMDLAGGDPKLLNRPTRLTDTGFQFSGGEIIDWRGRQDGTVMMIRRHVEERGNMASKSRDGLSVDLVDTRTLKSTQLEAPNDNASGYMSDHRGRVRLMSVPERRGNDYTGKTKYFYRAKGSNDWRELVAFQKETFTPLEIDAELDVLYALKETDGRDALYRIALDGTRAQTLVAIHPRYDIGGVVRSGDNQRVIGYTVYGEKRERIYFDPEFKALANSLQKVLPKLPIVSFADASSDGQKLLIYAGSDNDPGRYYLFDRRAKTLNEALIVRPELQDRPLAEMRPVTIPGEGGIQIPGYLTLPVGKDPRNLPAIGMPHGGPASRDFWGFDWLSQFFAARGYAVIQPQFRGSTGYGKSWQNDSAMKNWRAALSDVASSARWLSAQGIADPKRVAIFGWSYGGYAALQSAAINPELYQAVIAVAPVTDFTLLKQAYGNNTMISEMVGSGSTAASPLRNVNSIRAPVLLVHGDTDINVKIEHADKMYSALKGRGKPVEYLRYKGLDHQLPDATARAEMLKKSAELLERTIGR